MKIYYEIIVLVLFVEVGMKVKEEELRFVLLIGKKMNELMKFIEVMFVLVVCCESE